MESFHITLIRWGGGGPLETIIEVSPLPLLCGPVLICDTAVIVSAIFFVSMIADVKSLKRKRQKFYFGNELLLQDLIRFLISSN